MATEIIVYTKKIAFDCLNAPMFNSKIEDIVDLCSRLHYEQDAKQIVKLINKLTSFTPSGDVMLDIKNSKEESSLAPTIYYLDTQYNIQQQSVDCLNSLYANEKVQAFVNKHLQQYLLYNNYVSDFLTNMIIMRYILENVDV